MKQLADLHPIGLPASYIILPDGRAAGEVMGYADWDSTEAANLIESMLPKK